MAAKSGSVKTTYDISKVIQPIYTGGDVSIDRSGRILATCLGEEAVLTDLHTGVPLARIEGDGEILTALLITPQASHLISCSRSLSLKIYALEPFQDGDTQVRATLQRTLKPHTTPVITAAIDHTGTLLATGSADGAIKIWDIRGGYASHNFRGHGGVISALHFFEISSPNEPTSKRQHRRSQPEGDAERNDKETANSRFRLASGSEDGHIQIWDLVKRKAIATLDSHVSVVRSFDYSSRIRTLVSVSRDKTMSIWNTDDWKVRKVVPILESLESVGFLLDDRFIYTAGENGVLRIWDAETAREVTREQRAGGDGDALTHVLHPSPLSFVLCVHADQTFTLHSLEALSTLPGESTIDELPVFRRISGTHDEIIDLAFVTPQRELLALATNSEHIRLVSVARQITAENSIAGASYFGADVALLRGHDDIIISLDVDWSGCWIATGAKDNTARLWRIDHEKGTYDTFAILTGHAESIGAVALPGQPPPPGSSAHDRPLEHPPPFLITGSQDKTIKRWNISSNNSIKARASYTRKAHEKDINAIAIHHSSALFASASQDRLVKVWSVEEGEVQGVLRGHRRGVWTVQFAPKDTPSIGGDGGTASNARGLVLTGSGDKTIKIWSLSDYSCLRTFEGHTNSALKVLWLPPPKSDESTASHLTTKRTPQIASAGGDGLVKIWDASTGECTCTLDNHTDRIWALGTNPITPMLVSGGGDGVVSFWTDSTARTLAATAAASTARIEESQALENHIHAGRYREAIALALALNHPARLLTLFTAVANAPSPDPNSRSGLAAVDDVLAQLADEQLFTLFLRLRDWNANARTAPVAQRILGVVMRAYPATRLAALKGRRSGGSGVNLADVLEALRAYTERHYRRMEELVDESFLVDYTLREMEQSGFVDGRNGVDGDVMMV